MTRLPGEHDFIVARNRYGRYCVPRSSRHRPAAQKVLAGEVYEPQTIELICRACGNGDVIHAGTYFGDFLPALSTSLAPGRLIWAFEPNAENYRCAQGTLNLNNIANVILLNAGLGAKSERRLVRTHNPSGRSLGGASRVIPMDKDDGAGTEPVQILTIDDVVNANREVSVVQLDVEGFEPAALEGAITTIRRHQPMVIVENLILGADWFPDVLESLAYQRAGSVHENSVFLPRERVITGRDDRSANEPNKGR